jgi:alkylhydroperoxidase family enzyme
LFQPFTKGDCTELRAINSGNNAWREAPGFTTRERSALAWTEAVTLIADTHVPDNVYEAARREFSEQELVDLTMAVVAINGWNRLMITFRLPPAVTVRADSDR